MGYQDEVMQIRQERAQRDTSRGPGGLFRSVYQVAV